jgi:TrmH family RNA methyltransferase
MISQAEQKRIRALHQKKGRQETGRFLVQGRKVVAELLQSTWRTEAIYASEDAAAFIREAATTRAVPLHVLAGFELDKLGTFENGNELIAVAVQEPPPSFRLPAPDELILALDAVRDPRNMGGLLRIADWFGVRQVVCSVDTIDAYNPKVVQSTMGSLFRVAVRYTALAVELSAFASSGARVFLADMDGASVHETRLTRPAVLVLGSESQGLSRAVGGVPSEVVAIPRVGRAESLNVAMAAAALCAEFVRQRQLG